MICLKTFVCLAILFLSKIGVQELCCVIICSDQMSHQGPGPTELDDI